MIVSGWYDGHSTYGLRVQEANVSLFFRPEWETVTVYLPDETDPVIIPLTASSLRARPVGEKAASEFGAGSARRGSVPSRVDHTPARAICASTLKPNGCFSGQAVVRAAKRSFERPNGGFSG